MTETEADAAINQAEVDESRDFDDRLLAALQARAGEAGEMRLGVEEMQWLLRKLGAGNLVGVGLPDMVWSTAGWVPLKLEVK